MGMSQAEMRERVEELVDEGTLDEVLAALSDVCHEKAEHIRSAWQDRTTARAWEAASVTLDHARALIDV